MTSCRYGIVAGIIVTTFECRSPADQLNDCTQHQNRPIDFLRKRDLELNGQMAEISNTKDFDIIKMPNRKTACLISILRRMTACLCLNSRGSNTRLGALRCVAPLLHNKRSQPDVSATIACSVFGADISHRSPSLSASVASSKLHACTYMHMYMYMYMYMHMRMYIRHFQMVFYIHEHMQLQ